MWEALDHLSERYGPLAAFGTILGVWLLGISWIVVRKLGTKLVDSHVNYLAEQTRLTGRLVEMVNLHRREAGNQTRILEHQQRQLDGQQALLTRVVDATEDLAKQFGAWLPTRDLAISNATSRAVHEEFRRQNGDKQRAESARETPSNAP